MATWQKGQLWRMIMPPTDGTPMTLLAAAALKFEGTIDDAIDETMKSTSGDKSIVATIGPFDEGPKSDRGEGRYPRTLLILWLKHFVTCCKRCYPFFLLGSVILLEQRIPRSVGKVPLERGE